MELQFTDQQKFVAEIIENSTNLFGYFIKGRRGVVSKLAASELGLPASVDDLPEQMIARGLVSPKSEAQWRALFDSIDSGCRTGAFKVELIPGGKEKRAFYLSFQSVLDSGGAPSYALIFAEDVTLADEAGLRREEELRLSMTRMGKMINYYDVRTGEFTMPDLESGQRDRYKVVPNFPESLIENPPPELTPESLAIMKDFYDSIRRGEPSGSCHYPKIGGFGQREWIKLDFITTFDESGQPVRAVVTAENVTDSRAQADENIRLRQNERIFNIISRLSDRSILQYDLNSFTVRYWSDGPDNAMQGQSMSSFFDSAMIAQESRQELAAFSREIAGEADGEKKLLIKSTDSGSRWYDIKYSTIFDGDGRPSSVILSYTDITEQYEHELAYHQHIQSLENEAGKRLLYIESDLTVNTVNKVSGTLISPLERVVDCSHSDFGKNILGRLFTYEKAAESSQYFSIENLLHCYSLGTRHLNSSWQVRFADGSLRWLGTDVTLISDPYTDHVKAFFRMTDITGEKQAQLDMLERSQRDGMTGLFNRATAEQLIREALDQKAEPGILVLLDLDDLKSINDTFGHGQGDRAIKSISETLSNHFRESDIVGRVGGDEFIVFLPGAAENSGAIAVSVSALLRNLTGIAIGRNDERRIHCSIGCAVQTSADDSFELLFERADLALYHVKRSGKNNFAFYSPEMERADYQFQAQSLFNDRQEGKFKNGELQYLLNSISTYYPVIISTNLSKNDYYIMASSSGLFKGQPTFGVFDELVEMISKNIYPGDLSAYLEGRSRKTLLNIYAQGKKNIRQHFRSREGESYSWLEMITIFYTNKEGDVCDYTLTRRARERAGELEMLWLKKVLELAVVSNFEYICLIDCEDGQYYLYGNEDNTHSVPQTGSFNDITRGIAERFLAPEEREEYCRKACVETVAARMEQDGGRYSYRYNMPDGGREASFHWFESSHRQVLMTVSRCERTPSGSGTHGSLRTPE